MGQGYGLLHEETFEVVLDGDPEGPLQHDSAHHGLGRGCEIRWEKNVSRHEETSEAAPGWTVQRAKSVLLAGLQGWEVHLEVRLDVRLEVRFGAQEAHSEVR